MSFFNRLQKIFNPSGPAAGRQTPGTAPRPPQKRYDPAFMQELDQVIRKYSRDSLAFFIYEAANEQGLPTSAIEKLFEQYGRYSIKPSFLPYLPNQMESDQRLAPAISDWLKQKGIESPGSNWETAVEKYIWSSTKKEAEDIVSKVKGDPASGA